MRPKNFEELVFKIALEVGEQYPLRLKGEYNILTFSYRLLEELKKGDSDD